jgi:hypothetical protein
MANGGAAGRRRSAGVDSSFALHVQAGQGRVDKAPSQRMLQLASPRQAFSQRLSLQIYARGHVIFCCACSLLSLIQCVDLYTRFDTPRDDTSCDKRVRAQRQTTSPPPAWPAVAASPTTPQAAPIRAGGEACAPTVNRHPRTM